MAGQTPTRKLLVFFFFWLIRTTTDEGRELFVPAPLITRARERRNGWRSAVQSDSYPAAVPNTGHQQRHRHTEGRLCLGRPQQRTPQRTKQQSPRQDEEDICRFGLGEMQGLW